jgi:hypothetical protein
LPNGETDLFELHDRGPDASDQGDDLAEDGIFTGMYRNTKLKGPYRFLLRADIEKWSQHTDRSKYDPDLLSPRLVREVRLSAAVGDRADVKRPMRLLYDPRQGVLLTWPSVAGAAYTLQFSDSFPTKDWKEVWEGTGNGEPMEWLDDGNATGAKPHDSRILKRFYRLLTLQ